MEPTAQLVQDSIPASSGIAVSDGLLQKVVQLLTVNLTEGRRLTEFAHIKYQQIQNVSPVSVSEQETIKLACLVSALENEINAIQDALVGPRGCSAVLDQKNSEISPLQPLGAGYVLNTLNFLARACCLITNHMSAALELQSHLLKIKNINETTLYSTFVDPGDLQSTPSLQTITPQKIKCMKDGKWIVTHGGVELEYPRTGKATAYGMLMKGYEKQCDNIVQLEAERNALLQRCDQLTLHNAELNKKIDSLIASGEANVQEKRKKRNVRPRN